MQASQATPITIPLQITIETASQPTPTPTPSPSKLTQWFGEDFVTLVIILAFLLVVLATVVKKKWDVNAVRVISIASIVFIGVFAALTVANERNAAGVFALLGTVAGYILGKSEAKPSLTTNRTPDSTIVEQNQKSDTQTTDGVK